MEAKRTKNQAHFLTLATKLHIIPIVFDFHCHRHSPIQKSLMELFIENKESLSAPGILAVLKEKHPTINKSTVYRQLDFLVAKQILTVLEINGLKHYQLNQNHPHTILICTHCKKITPLKDTISTTKINKITTNNHFQINHYSLVLFGLCQKCQTN